jgi:NAD-dependent DNA ligase
VGSARTPGKEVTLRWGISFPASRSHHITLAETLSTNVTDLIPSTAEITAAGEQLDRAGFGADQQTVLGTEMGRVVMKAERGVVAGESSGAELVQAGRLGVPVIDEGGLRALLAGEAG